MGRVFSQIYVWLPLVPLLARPLEMRLLLHIQTNATKTLVPSPLRGGERRVHIQDWGRFGKAKLSF